MSQRAMPMADRISTLPETVLSHILSFLPTKDAVATSVLSKRWKPLWLSVPTLDFDDQYVKNKETHFRFLQFVYTVMLLRDVSQPIQRFSLKCVSSLCDPSNVNTWVNAAIQRKVEHLKLSLPSTIHLLSNVLPSRTLVVLKLRGLTVNAISSIGLPSLKIMHLRSVHFLERGYLIELLSGCPILEVLLIKSLKVGNFLTVGEFKSLPKLVKADISNSSTYIPLKGLYNVKFLRTEVRLSPSYVDILAFHNLTHMQLIFKLYYWDWLIEVLHECPKLQILVIDKTETNSCIKRSDDENWEYPQLVPKCLSSQLKICSLRKYGGQEGELRFARYIMQNARVLGTITICSTSSSTPQEKLQMIKKLSLCTSSSGTCELSFE